MVYRLSITLHGPEEEAGTVTKCAVDGLTYNKIRAAYPFAGRFHFRVKRRFEGSHVWWDLRGDPDAPVAVDDASRVELRALCLDAADPAWDGPVVAARAEGRADAARDYIREKTERAKEKAAELREKVKAHESVQKLQSKATEMRGKLSSRTANVRGKLSQWLDR